MFRSLRNVWNVQHSCVYPAIWKEIVFLGHKVSDNSAEPRIGDGLRKHWFLLGLFLVFFLTLADSTATVANAGQWLKWHGGPNAIIVLIFFISGLLIESDDVKSGIKDFQGTIIALILIFAVSPLVAIIPGVMPLSRGIKIGIFLTAVMPSTLSTGVVMTGAAGGNTAHALGITILSNGISVFTIPLTLSLLLYLIGSWVVPISIDKSSIMFQIGAVVIAPLFLGVMVRRLLTLNGTRRLHRFQILNQVLVLVIVWVSLSQSRLEILENLNILGLTALLAFCYHGLVLAVAGGLIHILKIPSGRRESIVFMGGQKTLVLSLILQVSLFPQYGLALVFCVVHHIVHLLMDGYLVGRLRA